jgi:hypothetical protein
LFALAAIIVLVYHISFRCFEALFMDNTVATEAFKKLLAKVHVPKAVTTFFFNQ